MPINMYIDSSLPQRTSNFLYVANFSLPTALKHHFVEEINSLVGPNYQSELKFSKVSNSLKAQMVKEVLELMFRTAYCSAHVTIVNSSLLNRNRFGSNFELSSEFRFIQGNVLYCTKAFANNGEQVAEIHLDSGPLQHLRQPEELTRKNWPEDIKQRLSGARISFTQSDHAGPLFNPIDTRLIQVADLLAGAVRQAHNASSLKAVKQIAAAPVTRRLGGRSIGLQVIKLSDGHGGARVSLGEIDLDKQSNLSDLSPTGSNFVLSAADQRRY